MMLLMVASIDSSNCTSPTHTCTHTHTHAITYTHTHMLSLLGFFAEHTLLLYIQCNAKGNQQGSALLEHVCSAEPLEEAI